MTKIKYVIGDATNPVLQEDEVGVIAHVVNNVGAWGAGFVLALSARDTRVEQAYLRWANQKSPWATKPFKLGASQTVYYYAGTNTRVVNMLAQDNVASRGQLVSYLYLWRCLLDLRDNTWARGETVHMPRIGCGIGGGDWLLVAALIEGTLCKADIPVTVYDLDEESRDEAVVKWGYAAIGL